MNTAIEAFRQKTSNLPPCELVYVVFPLKGLRKKINGVAVNNNNLKKSIGNYPLFCTSNKIKEVFSKCRDLTTFNNNILAAQVDGFWPKSFYYGPVTEGNQDFEKKRNNIIHDAGFKMIAEFYCAEPDDNIVGYYAIFSNSDLALHEEGLKSLSAASILELTHYYMTRRYPTLTNPYLFNGNIKEKTIKVIELTAKGRSCKEIGEIMHLTERGVSYHIEQAKQLFKANSKIDLVRIAKERCVI